MTAQGMAWTAIPDLPPLGFVAGADPACGAPGVDPEWFFPVYSGDDQFRKARQVCRRCPVRQACGAWATKAAAVIPLAGMWGGTTPEERAAAHIRRTRSAGGDAL